MEDFIKKSEETPEEEVKKEKINEEVLKQAEELLPIADTSKTTKVVDDKLLISDG